MKSKYYLLNIITSIVFLMCTSCISAQEKDIIISKTELPENAQNFINEYFENEAIAYIKKEDDLLSAEYDVKFTDGTEAKFDSKGNWEEIDGEMEEIPTGFISPKIINYVNKHFPGTQIVRIEKIFFQQQEIKISNGLELIFNSSGKFIKIDD